MDFDRQQDAHRWHQFVFTQMHPNLVEGRAEDAWRVLESSRYINLWTPAPQRDHIKKSFFVAWSRPAPEVGHSFLLNGAGSAVGLSAVMTAVSD